MPSRPKANPSTVSLADKAVDAGRRHPGMVFLLLFAGYVVAQTLGWLPPLDWWGTSTGR